MHIDDMLTIYRYFNSVNECVKEYPKFMKYFENYVKTSKEWALHYR